MVYPRIHFQTHTALALVALLAITRSSSASGDLDPTFGTGGIVTTAVGADDDAVSAALLQPGGAVVVAGWASNGTDRDVLLARYDDSGLLDPTFGTGGIVVTDLGGDERAEAIVRRRDGRIVVAGAASSGGASEILVLCYDPGGALDPAFGTGGIVRTPLTGGAAAMAALADGNEVVVAGSAGSDFVLVRYRQNGTLDGFGDGGIVRRAVGTGPAVATAIVEQAGRLVVAGWAEGATDSDVFVAHYRNNGNPDDNFGDAGIVTTPLPGDDVLRAIARLPGGALAAVGWSATATSTDVLLLRFREDGNLDERFGSAGVVRTSIGEGARGAAVARDLDGGLLVAGEATLSGASTFALLHYTRTGSLDPLFGSGGVVTTPIGSGATARALLQLPATDERIVLAGQTASGGGDLALARYLRPPRCGNSTVEAETGELCDDGNRAAGDCCGSTCQYDPADSACVDDSDACTADRCDAAGVCTHPPAGGPCEHHLCYRARSPRPFLSVPLALGDAFETASVRVAGPRALCPPASVDGATISDGIVYQESYRLRAAAHQRRQDVRVVDRFGTLRLRLGRPDRLLAPTHATLDAPPPGAPAMGAANHFACYRAEPALGAPRFPSGVQAEVTDAFESRRYDVLGPRRLCLPADAGGQGIANPVAHLTCYAIRRALGEPAHTRITGRIHTANELGPGRLGTLREEDLCVPALREPCGALPPCQVLGGQSPDCSYDPAISDPAYPFCGGPKVLIDAAHDNFHTLESDGVAGRYWGFGKLLLNDGYDVQQTNEASASLLAATDAAVLVIANATAERGPMFNGVKLADVAPIVEWVAAGGALLLVIDHDPYDRVDALLSALGLTRLKQSVGERTFRRSTGDLNGGPIADGPGPDTAVLEVTTFLGTAVRVASAPPTGATYDPVLRVPPQLTGNEDGYMQGVAIHFGAGRVYVSAEAGGLTAQGGFGMHNTWDNERYVRNVISWLTQ